MAVSSVVILCVDDEDIPRTLRKMVLIRQGYTVLSAVSAAEALELLDQHHVDLVLTDQMMPGIVGTELAKKLRISRPSLPIIIVSGVNEIPEDVAKQMTFHPVMTVQEVLDRALEPAQSVAHVS